MMRNQFFYQASLSFVLILFDQTSGFQWVYTSWYADKKKPAIADFFMQCAGSVQYRL